MGAVATHSRSSPSSRAPSSRPVVSRVDSRGPSPCISAWSWEAAPLHLCPATVPTGQCLPSCTEHQPAPHRRGSLQCQRVCVCLSPFEMLHSPKVREWSTPWSQNGVPIAPHVFHCFSRGWHSRRVAPRRAPRAIWDRVRGRGGQLASAERSAAPTCPQLKPWVLPASVTSQQKVTRYCDMIPCSPISFTFHHAHAFLLKFYSVKH